MRVTPNESLVKPIQELDPTKLLGHTGIENQENVPLLDLTLWTYTVTELFETANAQLVSSHMA